MNVSAKATYQGREQSTSDTNYWVGTMGWGQVDFDTIWHYGSGHIESWSNPTNAPSTETSHWAGHQSMHYTNGSTQAYGHQFVVGAGNPAYCYLRGRWGTTATSWAKMWNSANDGAGSGLDADTLDGQQASAFQAAGTYNTIIGTDSDINTSGSTIIDNIYVTDGVITSMGTRTLTLANLGYTGATNANYITNNNQLTNGAGYLTSSSTQSKYLRSDTSDSFTGSLTNNGNNHITFGPNSTWGNYLRIGGNGYQGNSTTANIASTNGNLHLDAADTSRATYLNYYAGTSGVSFGNGAEAIVAWMGPDGDLWKGSGDNTGSKYWHAGNDGSGSGLDADKLDGLHASSFNQVIGTDSDINTSGAAVLDQLVMTDGVITSHSTRNLTLANLGYTGATNANYITNNNQLTNGAGYVTTNTTYSVGDGGLTQKNFTSTLKTKLDGIATGATNVTNNNQLTNGAGYVTTDTNTTYSAGRGLDLSGTQFLLETDLRDSISYIGYDSNDYIHWSNNSYCRTVVAGTERFRVQTNGVDVNGVVFANALRTDASSTSYSLITRNTAASNYVLYVQSPNSGGTQKIASFRYGSASAGGGTEVMKIARGSVDIGNSTSGSNLTVAGSITGNSKNFSIPHPSKEGKRLIHSCLEGPEIGVYFRGRSTSATIEMPDYWGGLVHLDSMTVELTAIGPNQDLYVKDVADNGEVTVGSNTEESLNYFYVIYGERKDLDKLDIEVDEVEIEVTNEI